MAKLNSAALTKRQGIRVLEAKRDSLIVKKAGAHKDLSAVRDQLKRARAK